jgi:hypothetical protein
MIKSEQEINMENLYGGQIYMNSVTDEPSVCI